MSSFKKPLSNVATAEDNNLETRTKNLEVSIIGVSEQLSLLTNMLMKQNHSRGNSNYNSFSVYSETNEDNDDILKSPTRILANTCGSKPEDFNIFTPPLNEDNEISPFVLANDNDPKTTIQTEKSALKEWSLSENSNQDKQPICIQFPDPDVWLSKEFSKVKQSDLTKGIDYRYVVYSNSFDFEMAANLRIYVPTKKTRLTTVIAPTGFSAWASFADNLNLHELDDGARYLSYKFYWLFTEGGERAPFFDTTNLHHFCSAAASFFKKLNERYTFLRKIWCKKEMNDEEKISEEEERDLCEVAYVDPTYSMRIYRKLYKCLEEAKKKWVESRPCLVPINNPLPLERQRKIPTKSNGSTKTPPSSLLSSQSIPQPVPFQQLNSGFVAQIDNNEITTTSSSKKIINSRIEDIQESQSMRKITETIIEKSKESSVDDDNLNQIPQNKRQKVRNLNSISSLVLSSSIIPESQVSESMQKTGPANQDSAKSSCKPAQTVSPLYSLNKQTKPSNRQLLIRGKNSKSITALKANVTLNTSNSKSTKQNSQSSSSIKSTTAISRKLNNETNQPVLSAKVKNDSSSLKSQDNLKKRRITKPAKLTL